MTTSELEKILFLDIETVPLVYNYNDLSSPAKELWDKKWQFNRDTSPAEHYQKAGIFAEFAKVVVIGLGYYHQGRFRVKALASDNEAAVLEQLSDLMARHFSGKGHFLCAHNGKEFDFPFLCRRFLINNLPLPKLLQIQGLRPWEVKHVIDTMELWKFGDIKNYSSLQLLAHVLGIPSPKNDIDGSQVARVFYEERDLEKIANYCKKDVITLARVYQRFAGAGNLEEEAIIFV